MKKLFILLVASVFLTVGCGSGNGVVIHRDVEKAHDVHHCESHTVGKVPVMTCGTTHYADQPFVIVEGEDRGTSREDLDWVDYKNCLEGKHFPECADEQ